MLNAGKLKFRVWVQIEPDVQDRTEMYSSIACMQGKSVMIMIMAMSNTTTWLLIAQLCGSGPYMGAACTQVDINEMLVLDPTYSIDIIIYYIASINVTKMAAYKVVSFMLVIAMVVLKAQGLSDVEAIEAVARRYEAALAVGDIDTIAGSLYAEDCRVFPDNSLPLRGQEGR